jgi:DNA sulfur modification protein DndD
MATLEEALERASDEYKLAEAQSLILGAQRTEAREIAMSMKAELASQGGAWSVNRLELEAEMSSLRDERRKREDSIREALNGVGIFRLASQVARRVSTSLLSEGEKLEADVIKTAVLMRSEELKKTLRIAVKDAEGKGLARLVDDWVCGFEDSSPEDKAQYGLSAADIRKVREQLNIECTSEGRMISANYSVAKSSLLQEEKIQDQLAHAPSDETIKSAFEAMTSAAEKVGAIDAQWRAAIEEQRRLTWISIDLVRKLKKCEERLVSSGTVERSHAAADAAQNFIFEFKLAAAKHKCQLLKCHFVEAFKRLARKEDIIRDATIDAETFKVILLDSAGREVAKKRLSAGEKQIYSIAMLEALAKTSGRNLPVIIDTPLGRLDSKHRTKLVESYFPVASHQVIVLSTDTEVDSKFYDALSNKISHAFHLSYDEENGSTVAETGYFWRHSTEGHSHAA